MTVEESRQSVPDVLQSTINALGSEGWSGFSERVEECTLNDGRTGVNFISMTTGPGAEETSEIIETVKGHWTDLGMTTETVETNAENGLITLYGAGGPLDGISMVVSTDHNVVQAESICVPGDAGGIIDQENPDILEQG